jgi:hypothetical protein
MPPNSFREKTMSNKLIDMVGKKFGKLTITGRAPNPKGQALWIGVCECGDKSVYFGNNLRRRQYLGCDTCGRRKPVVFRLYTRYKGSAKRRGYVFSLDREEFGKLVKSDCYYCGQPPRTRMKVEYGGTILYNGIDRRDNSIGYVPENCVSCCECCNRAKLAMSESEFLQWIVRVYQFTNGKYNTSSVCGQ